MMKAIILLQTIILGLLPASINRFNISLSVPLVEETAKVTDSKPIYAFGGERLTFLKNKATYLSFEETIGKVIKESQNQKTDYRIKTVVIDAGHGGKDPGCSGGNSREKHLALGIAKKVTQAMATQYPNIRFIMTRDKDVFIPLYERAAIANRNNADLFISIHCNYMPKRSDVMGTETYVMGLHTAEHNLEVAKRENDAILLESDYERNYDYDPNSTEGHIMLSMFQNAYLEQSILFAEIVEEKFEMEAKRRSRGVKQAGFVVLKETAMPSVLLETGFLSSAKEERYLKSEQGQWVIADAILKAFIDYKITVESQGYTSVNGAPPVASNEINMTAKGLATPHMAQPATTSVPAVQTTPPPSTNVPPIKVYEERNPKVIPNPQQTYNNKAYSAPEPNRTAIPSADVSKNIQFFVQLAASPQPLDTGASKWKNLNYLVEIVMEDNLYKYQARNFRNINQAYEARLVLQQKGFSDAFIVAYKDGKRVPVEQAKKELGLN